MMFRQIQDVTKNYGEYIKEVVFVDCNGCRSRIEEIKKIVEDGFNIDDEHYVYSERSASMTRNAILGFISEKISEEIEKRITMDIEMDKTVLSKWCAYRGLMFSSCHCLDGWKPKVVVVDDYEKVLENQHIKWLVDEEKKYVSYNDGKEKTWKTHGIIDGYKDIKINVFDGFGIIHPELANEIKEIIGIEENPTTFMLRAPYIKGLVSAVDYTKYFKDNNIDYIKDIWGKWHSVEDKMIILTKSMYKGYKYFYETGTFSDWDKYWSKFEKYNHCIGIAKWNFTSDKEPVYTRGNYQILQDLDLPFEDFKQLAGKSLDWAYRIVNGDRIYTYCFLGLASDNPKPLNNYSKAILKNPMMLYEHNVRDFLKRQTKKYIDQMKCGKIYLKACYKFLVPDIIMLLQWIGGEKEPSGCLESNEFWSLGYLGKHAIERNPHICKSEHLVLNAVNNELIEKYIGNLENVCMINGKSLSAQRMNGADQDGDLVLVLDEPLMLDGINENCAIVLNIDEKTTALAEEINKENVASLASRTMVSLIGECSNAATCYHNKPWKTKETKDRYEKNIDILSIVNSFAIDFAKTGYIMQIPYEIAKYSKPYPYFMRYISDYYDSLYNSMEKGNSQYKFQKSKKSNMNQLAFMVEKFNNREIKWKRAKNFDYKVMMDDSIAVDEEKLKKIEEIFIKFNREVKYLASFEKKLHRYKEFKDELKAWDAESAMNYRVNWNSIYDGYRRACSEICPNQNELANIVVYLCYVKYPRRAKKFIWVVASSGILDNIKSVDFEIPIKDDFGEYEYLGKRYSLRTINYDSLGI